MNRTVSLPDDLVRRAEELARREGISVDLFVAAHLKDQFADLEYLASRAARSSEEGFRGALTQIPDVPAEPDDQIS